MAGVTSDCSYVQSDLSLCLSPKLNCWKLHDGACLLILDYPVAYSPVTGAAYQSYRQFFYLFYTLVSKNNENMITKNGCTFRGSNSFSFFFWRPSK